MRSSLELFCPAGLQEALDLLSDAGGAASVIGGGTDVIPGLRTGALRFRPIERLVDINGVPELKCIRQDGDEIVVGAGNNFTDLADSQLVQDHAPLLAQAAESIGSVQIRNRATIGGNLANNAPCADSIPPLLAYNATVRILSASGERLLALQDLLLEPYRTTLRPGELLAEIRVPILRKRYAGRFFKLGRRRGVAISRISLAVLLRLANERVSGLRIASGAVTPVPSRFSAIEESARNEIADSRLFIQVSRSVAEQILEMTGLRWSSSYKLPVLQLMLYQILQSLAIRAREEGA